MQPEAGDGEARVSATTIGRAAPPELAARVLSAIGTDPTQAFIFLDPTGTPRWASPSIDQLFDLDMSAGNPLAAAMHPDDVELVLEIFGMEQDGRADETYDLDRRFELFVRLRSPRGHWRWIALRLHNRLDDPWVDGMVLQLTLANQERSTVEAFDAAALGGPSGPVLEYVLSTLATGGSADAHAVAFDAEGRCLATTAGAPIGPGTHRHDERWTAVSDGRVDVCVPIIGPDGTEHGTLVTISNFPDVRPFTRALAASVARRAGLVLASARDRDELLRQAGSDPLTGLYNRRFLHHHLERGSSSPWMAVAFVDLDGFKAVNDRCGHHVGDEVLLEVARRMRSLGRPGDIVARLGGDEFVLVRHGSDERDCSIDPADVTRAVTGEFVVGEHHLGVSASVGVVSAPSSRGVAVLVDADAAMYRDKTARRS